MNPLRSILLRWLPAGLATLALHAPLQAAESLRLCLPDLEAAPYLNAIGKPPGLIERMYAEAGRQAGVVVSIARAPIRRCTLQFQQGEVDGMIAGPSASNRELARFPTKGDAIDPARRIVRVSTVWVQRRDSALQWDGQHFSKAGGGSITVGTLRAVAIVSNALQLQGYRLEDSSGSIHQLLQQLRIGRVQAAVGIVDQVQRELASGQFGDLEIIPGTASQHDFYPVFRKELYAASPALIENFWEKLARVRELPAYQPPR